MALEDLVQKITADAQAHAERVIANATITVAQIATRAAQDEEAARKAFREETERQLQKEKALTLERAHQEARALVEQAKRTVLNQTFAKALRAAAHASDAEYEQNLAKPATLIAESREVMRVAYAPKDRVELTKRALAAAGIATSVEARDDIQGGFVAVGDACEYDARFEQLIAQTQRKHESEIATMLFTA